MHYYNEIDEYAATWIENLILDGRIPDGHVDRRSVVDVVASDLSGYVQCHFFAGIAGWALAARIAGWPEDRELWTGSAPCQPFSVAGQQRGTDDDRHLWPHLFRLASARRPAVLMGEQVAAAVGKNWLDGIAADLEGIGYACRAVVVPACAVDAPHRRDRLWFVADNESGRRGLCSDKVASAGEPERQDRGFCSARAMAGTDIARASEERQQRSGQLGGAGGDQGACVGCGRSEFDCCGDPRPCVTCGKCWDDCTCVLPGPFVGDVADALHSEWRPQSGEGNVEYGQDAGREKTASRHPMDSAWSGAGWIIGHDGKARRVEPSIRLLAHGVPARVGRLRAYGNAIVPQVAAEVIGAYMDCMP